MKNIVRFQIVKPQGKVTIDSYNPDFREMEIQDFLNMYLPYTRLFEHITIKNFVNIPEALMNRLTNQYLHGAEIEFITPSRHFNQTYKISNSSVRPFYTYRWTPLDLSAPIPKSLSMFEFNYKGHKTTYLDAIKTLRSTAYLPNEIWNALDEYSAQQIDKCREYNKGIYSCAEDWYKDLMHNCIAHNIKMFSPNKKTYFEVMAEITFDKDCLDAQLEQGLRPLNYSELLFLQQYAPAYGVEIPTFKWRINSRKTEHGYTQEPERVYSSMSNSDWDTISFDSHSQDNLPKFVRKGLVVQECDNSKLLRSAYFQLKWIMKHLKDDGLMPDWKRCPICHKIYRESEGCECGASPAIEFVNADNLFYSNAASYEDYESTVSAYNELYDDEKPII